MTEPLLIPCAHCAGLNRIPATRIADSPRCGRCKQNVLSPQPFELNQQNFKAQCNGDLPLLVDVWASWCGPCRAEMGSLERLSRLKGASQFTLIGISTDDHPEAALVFVQRTGTSFGHFIDQRLVLENMLGADRLPLTVLVDAQGRVVDKIVGAREWDSPESLKLIGKAFRIRL